ncbi:hypothetical protein C8R47DRAFT_1212625 [Mycena vitilis]|nr:hypothetical protein C8R47DRAFT_1212625 [Mycena vitilis]
MFVVQTQQAYHEDPVQGIMEGIASMSIQSRSRNVVAHVRGMVFAVNAPTFAWIPVALTQDPAMASLGDVDYQTWISHRPIDFERCSTRVDFLPGRTPIPLKHAFCLIFCDQDDFTQSLPLNTQVNILAGTSNWRGSVMVLRYSDDGQGFASLDDDDVKRVHFIVQSYEGSDWYPIDADAGSEDDPVDLAWWHYCRDTSEAPELNAMTPADKERARAQFKCKICLQTFFMPVVPLCMHVFCYRCLLFWFKNGRLECAECDAVVEEKPMKDNAFEMALSTAISDGIVDKSPLQPGRRVTAPEGAYRWEGITFARDSVDNHEPKGERAAS